MGQFHHFFVLAINAWSDCNILYPKSKIIKIFMISKYLNRQVTYRSVATYPQMG